jgi:hypothetical protein
LTGDTGSPFGCSVGSSRSSSGSRFIEDLLNGAGSSVGSVSGDSIDGSDVFIISERIKERIQLIKDSGDLGLFTRESLVLGLRKTNAGSTRNGFGSSKSIAISKLAV